MSAVQGTGVDEWLSVNFSSVELLRCVRTFAALIFARSAPFDWDLSYIQQV